MHTFEAIQIGDDLPFLSVEDGKLVSVHVKPPAIGIQALVMEANGRP
jgi:hypothetical protein